MKALREPLEMLTEVVSLFASERERRLLVVLVDERLRGPALDVVTAIDNHADDRSAVVRLDEPFAADDLGWGTRAARLRADVEAPAAATAPSAGAAAPPGDTVGGDLGSFAGQLADLCATAHAADRAGVTLVLAPTVVEVPDAVVRDVGALIRAATISAVRWIVVTDDEALAMSLADQLGEPGELAACRVDEARLRTETAAAVSSAGTNSRRSLGSVWPAGKQPPSRQKQQPGKRSRTAKPSVAPESPTATDSSEVQGQAARIAGLAVAALSGGQPAEAVRLQTLARDQLTTAALIEDAVRAELLLATYQIRLDPESGGGLEVAQGTFHQALERAIAARLPREAAQAALGEAQVRLMNGTPDEAVRLFLRAASLAEEAVMGGLAIEALRSAGQTAFATGADRAAASTWKAALRLTASVPAEEVRASSAGECARLLAGLCRRHDRLQVLAADLDQAAGQLDDKGRLDEMLQQRLGLTGPTLAEPGEDASLPRELGEPAVPISETAERSESES